ncbi:MAG TPA: LLM class flavin-dependent oxidoreductase [Candidatus Nitrosopolaris sp.]|nr:LLM class flavin-dependent oxidoreductase [Candidatus Nitrosopolaris sp.]
MLKAAVQLPATIGDVGEYLADVTALEAAGADTIWLDDTALDPWIVLGAMAAVTHRIGLGCRLTSMREWSSSRLGHSVATLQTLSRGRTVVALPELGNVSDHIAVLRAAGSKILTTESKHESADGVILAVESADEIADAVGTHVEVWAAIGAPPDRDAWASARSAYEGVGATGVIVPWSDRIVDLLRNSEPDDRSDLLMSTG